MNIYQCIPSRSPVKTSRLIRDLLIHPKIEIALDLEDSIQNIIAPNKNEQLKQDARQDLKEILSLLPLTKRYHVRINAISSRYFEKDMEVVKSLSNRIKSVIIPKVEYHADLNYAIELMTPYVSRFSIIVESEKGASSIQKILGNRFRANIDYVIFGNYDYQLDQNIYPIRDQDSDWYWNTLAPLIKKIEALGYSFANSPYAHIRDLKTLVKSVETLESICQQNFALISLHKSQTLAYKHYLQGEIKTYKDPTIEPQIRQKKLPDCVFSFTNQGKMITPQEVQLSLRNHGK